VDFERRCFIVIFAPLKIEMTHHHINTHQRSN
jgi:hypothetical protein